MFSICLYDYKQDKILIYRDRLGIKPLYYFKNEQQFIFSSSLSSIKKLKRNISPSKESCLLFYLFNYFPDSKTVYDGVFKLKPGNLIIISNGKFSIKEYWKLKKNNTLKYEDSKKEILNLLVNSVKINLRSDVPIATLLSGGMDSSILALLISKESKLQQTLSVDYIGKKFNEGENAKLFYNKIGSIHTSIKLDQKKFFSIFKEIFSKIDEPNADSALISSFALAREAKKKVLKYH